MNISILLGEKICSMVLACLIGFTVVRMKLLRREDSRIIAKLVAYVCIPCALVSAYMIEFTFDRLQGLVLATIIAGVWHFSVIHFSSLLSKIFHLNKIERASVIYSNAGNLIIPVTYAVLGTEWVFYTSAFSLIQAPLLWTHGRALLCGEKKYEWKKTLLNPNFMAIYIGVILFVTGWSFPTVMELCIDDFGAMLGSLSMFVIGMLMGEEDLIAILKIPKIYLVSFLRLVVVPLFTVGLFWIIIQVVSHPDICQILMVVLWAASAPVGTMVTQLSQIYGEDAEYASKINLISNFFCVITMPLITYIYDFVSVL